MEILIRLGVALAIGLLIGLERGWHQRDLAEGERVAGFRTFGLVSLLGAAAVVLGGDQGLVLAAIAAALGVVAGIGYLRVSRSQRGHSATGTVALLLTFALGAMAGRGYLEVASSAAVVVTLLLGVKPELHGLVRAIER
ncbi:MAG TPA: MgtC/SapB family protein, partial [Candidatus Binatia bacterium]|nr:MgtC/SapB family protein [Candidatus Binatia bacterium]